MAGWFTSPPPPPPPTHSCVIQYCILLYVPFDTLKRLNKHRQKPNNNENWFKKLPIVITIMPVQNASIPSVPIWRQVQLRLVTCGNGVALPIESISADLYVPAVLWWLGELRPTVREVIVVASKDQPWGSYRVCASACKCAGFLLHRQEHYI